MLTSTLSNKGQITIPKEIRKALGLRSGDVIACEVHDAIITLKRIKPFDATFHMALSKTLTEWSTPDDNEAFRHL